MVFIVYHTQRIGYLLLTSLKKYVSSEIVIFITILYKGIFKLHLIKLKFDILKINFPATCFKNLKNCWTGSDGSIIEPLIVDWIHILLSQKYIFKSF